MKLLRVPLRISLAGGGSDLPSHFEKHGGAVCSFTINKFIYIASKPCTDLFPHKYRLVYSKVEERDHMTWIEHPIIRSVAKEYNVCNGLDLDVMSDIPAGTGMGSSSAFTVGLHQSFSSVLLPAFELATRAVRTELFDLKEPIGVQDQYAAAYGGCNLFEFTKNQVFVSPVPNGLDDRLHLIYLGKARSASALLKEQTSKDNSVALNKMAALAQVVASYLRNGAYDDIGEAIRHGWELKKTLSPNISNERIDTIIDTALANGATGGKLLGAGGTGFVLLFCPSENKYRMLEGLLPLNLKYVPFEREQEGCKILYED